MNDRQRLEEIITVVCKYLPNDGMSREEAMSQIIELVVPLPEPSEQEPFARLLHIMGTFDLAAGHADNINDLIDSLESELRDVLGHYREALKAQPKQEPIAWVAGYKTGQCVIAPIDGATVLPTGLALYTAQPERAWIGLTDEEIKGILDCGRGGIVDIKKAEQILKEMNNG